MEKKDAIEAAARELDAIPLVADQSSIKDIDQLKDYTRNAVPLKKVGIPDNVGPMIAYLSSPAADFITGSEIVMDGGMLLV